MQILIEMDPYNAGAFEETLREFCATSWSVERRPPDAFPRRVSPAMSTEAAEARFHALRRIADRHFDGELHTPSSVPASVPASVPMGALPRFFAFGDFIVRLRPTRRERMLPRADVAESGCCA